MDNRPNIKDMVGYEYNYKGNVYFINGYDIQKGEYIIDTNKGYIGIALKFIEAELKKFHLIGGAPPNTNIKKLTHPKVSEIKEPKKMAEKKTTLEHLEKVNSLVIDAMEKVTKDKSYVKQAGAISQLSNSSVNTMKVIIQLEKKGK